MADGRGPRSARKLIRKIFELFFVDLEPRSGISRLRLRMVVGVGMQPNPPHRLAPDGPQRRIEQPGTDAPALGGGHEAEMRELNVGGIGGIEFAETNCLTRFAQDEGRRRWSG